MRLMTVNKKQLAVDVFKTMDGVASHRDVIGS